MKKSIILILALMQLSPSFAKTKNKARPSDKARKDNKTRMSFIDYRSDIWDENFQSKLATMNEFPSALYDVRGFQISEKAEKKSISSLNYINAFIRSPDIPLLGFSPIMDKNELVGVHLNERYLNWELTNARKDIYILRPKGRHTFYVQFSDGTTNLDNYFMYEAHREPKLARTAKLIQSQFGFTPVLRRETGNKYTIGGAVVDENPNQGFRYSRSSGFGLSIDADGVQIGAWNTRSGNLKPVEIKAFDLPLSHAVRHIGKFTQFTEQKHGQENVIFKFLKELSPIQKAMYNNTYNNDSPKLTATHLADLTLEPNQKLENSEPENIDARLMDIENAIEKKNRLHRNALNSLLVVEDQKVQDFLNNTCTGISKQLKLSSKVAPKCFVLASYQPFMQVLGGNHIFISAGTLSGFHDYESLVGEISRLFAHVLNGDTASAIPFQSSVGDQALPLAIAGNYLSYASLIEGNEKKFIKSWFPQLALHPNSMANLGQTLIAQNLLVAASSFSMQQEFAVEAEASGIKLETIEALKEQGLSLQMIDVIEIIKR